MILHRSLLQIYKYFGQSPDYKWKVEASQAGNYKISINVIDMKVKFEKK